MTAIEIARHTPLWVWGVLTGLVFAGVSMMRPRSVGVARLVIMPSLLVAYSLLSLIRLFPDSPVLVPAWGGGLALALLVARLLIASPRGRLDPASGRVQVPGSIVPLVAMLAIFSVKFVVGFAAVQAAHLMHDPQFVSAVSVACGLLSGTLAARSLALLSLFRTHRSHYGPTRPAVAAMPGEPG